VFATVCNVLNPEKTIARAATCLARPLEISRGAEFLGWLETLASRVGSAAQREMPTVRRLRPLARRRLRTRRPFLVAMRARNPWVRLRFTLLGWYVRFMAVALLKVTLKQRHAHAGKGRQGYGDATCKSTG